MNQKSKPEVKKENKKDWIDVLFECTCGRKHEFRVHGVKDDAWIEKTNL